jgi:hypothetical protein
VYGDPAVHPQTEDYWGNVNPVGPRGVYDEAKRYQEAITMAYHTYHGLETRIVRIFNTYGPRMRLNDGRVLPAFIGQALRGEDLTVFGDGSQTRSFCYVDDLIEGIYRLLLSDYAYPVNIGNPGEITIKDFAEEILKLTGANQKVIYKDLPTDDPKQRRPDITLARKLLGWEPKVNRKEGLEKTYAYFKTLTKDDLYKKELVLHPVFLGNTRLILNRTWLISENTQLIPNRTRLISANTGLILNCTRLISGNTGLILNRTWLISGSTRLIPNHTRLISGNTGLILNRTWLISENT